MKLNNQNEIWIPAFRILISFYAFISIISLWHDIPKILHEGAYLKPELLDGITDNYTPTIYDLDIFLNQYINIEFNLVADLIIYIHCISLLFLFLGLITRTSAIIALLTQLVIIKSMHFFLYGADFFLSMALFYCIIFPKSKFSIDYLLFKFKKNAIANKWSLLLLQTHVCIIYFFSGLDKGLGINWYNGESIWRAISGHNYNGLIDLTSMAIPLFIFKILGILTLIIEFCYPLFINIKYTRNLWLSLTISLHISIAVFMGLYLFAMIMIIFNLCAFYFPYLKIQDTKYLSKSTVLLKFVKTR